MANQALARLESALRARKLDRTLTTALPLRERCDAASAPTGLAALDARLPGGLPRGQLSEVVGPRSSGRTTLVLQMMASAAAQGEIVALVDPFDRLDVESAAAAGLDLDRLLWVRGHGTGAPDRAVDRALKALNLVLQAGGFALVALDLADVAPRLLRQIPFTTWLRVARVIEGSDTACVLIVAEPLARSAGGLTLRLEARPRWAGAAPRSRWMAGLDLAVRVVSPRHGDGGPVRVAARARDARLEGGSSGELR
ncbi:MAG TPA: hypothetical protein VNI78_03020 [Vicinamibacterales bacterium]|nr:hypothetical protein [Vicinamibacterales bacterium]